MIFYQELDVFGAVPVRKKYEIPGRLLWAWNWNFDILGIQQNSQVPIMRK